MANDLVGGDPAQKPKLAAKPAEPAFRPASFYHPDARFGFPVAPVVARSESEAQWFLKNKWQSEEEFVAPQRAAERFLAEKAFKDAEQAAVLAAKIQEEEIAAREAATAEQKRRDALAAAEQSRRQGRDAKVEFVIAVSKSKIEPLEEARRRGGERFVAAAYQIGTLHDNQAEIERLARVIISIADERRRLKAQIDEASAEYSRHIAALESSRV